MSGENRNYVDAEVPICAGVLEAASHGCEIGPNLGTGHGRRFPLSHVII